MWTLIILAIIDCLTIGIHLAKHGEPKDGNYNVFIKLLDSAIIWWLLYKAGLFDKYL